MQVECSICWDKIKGRATEDICATKCGHVFHDKCLNNWLLRSESCPHCRTVVRKEDCIRLFLNSLQQSSEEVTTAELSSMPEEELWRRFQQISNKSAMAVNNNAFQPAPTPAMNRPDGKIDLMKLDLKAKIASADGLKILQILSYRILKEWQGGDNAISTFCLKNLLELEGNLVDMNKNLTDRLGEWVKLQTKTRMLRHPRT